MLDEDANRPEDDPIAYLAWLDKKVHERAQDPDNEWIRWIGFDPGDGFRYNVFVSPLPNVPEDPQIVHTLGMAPDSRKNILGGSAEGHVLVSVEWHWGSGCQVMSKDGFLDDRYVAEKFVRKSMEPQKETVELLVDAIGFALGRQTRRTFVHA